LKFERLHRKVICVCCRSLRKSELFETIGFEVDEVKNADAGDCMVRLTVYHRTSGNVSVVLTSTLCSPPSVIEFLVSFLVLWCLR